MNAPEPLVGPDVDCTDLDGFMLNVERLMASELVALSSHEVIGAALLVWCRAWKQRPAASLPNDEKVIAAFARMPLPKFRKLRDEVLRGFVLCSDGRLYHTTLAREAANAYERKVSFQRKREADAERLRKWRSGNKHETPHETHVETRFVAEGQGQGQGQGHEYIEDHHHLAGGRAGAHEAAAGMVEAVAPTAAGGICRRLRQAGIADVNPGHPRLLALIDAGATVDEFVGFVPAAIDKGAGFAWVLGAVEGERTRAVATAGRVHRGPLAAVSAAEPAWLKDKRDRVAAFSPGVAMARPATTTVKDMGEIFDATPQRLG